MLTFSEWLSCAHSGVFNESIRSFHYKLPKKLSALIADFYLISRFKRAIDQDVMAPGVDEDTLASVKSEIEHAHGIIVPALRNTVLIEAAGRLIADTQFGVLAASVFTHASKRWGEDDLVYHLEDLADIYTKHESHDKMASKWSKDGLKHMASVFHAFPEEFRNGILHIFRNVAYDIYEPDIDKMELIERLNDDMSKYAATYLASHRDAAKSMILAIYACQPYTAYMNNNGFDVDSETNMLHLARRVGDVVSRESKFGSEKLIDDLVAIQHRGGSLLTGGMAYAPFEIDEYDISLVINAKYNGNIWHIAKRSSFPLDFVGFVVRAYELDGGLSLDASDKKHGEEPPEFEQLDDKVHKSLPPEKNIALSNIDDKKFLKDLKDKLVDRKSAKGLVIELEKDTDKVLPIPQSVRNAANSPHAIDNPKDIVRLSDELFVEFIAYMMVKFYNNKEIRSRSEHGHPEAIDKYVPSIHISAAVDYAYDNMDMAKNWKLVAL